TEDHEGGEAEATTTLHDLGDAVDGDDALDVLRLLVVTAPTVVAAPATAAVAAASLDVVPCVLVVCGGPVASAVTTLTSRHQTVLPLAVSAVVLIIRTPTHRSGRRRRVTRSGRGTCCHHGRTRPCRCRRPWRARPGAVRPSRCV